MKAFFRESRVEGSEGSNSEKMGERTTYVYRGRQPPTGVKRPARKASSAISGKSGKNYTAVYV